MELSNELVMLGHKAQALAYYQQALENITENAMRLFCLRHKLNLEIDCGRFIVFTFCYTGKTAACIRKKMQKEEYVEKKLNSIYSCLISNLLDKKYLELN